MKKIFYYSLLLFTLFAFFTDSKKKKKDNIDPKNMPRQEMKNRFITFKINKSKWPDLDYFSKIFAEFFLNAGIKMQLVNMGDSELLGITDESAIIDKQAILDNFEGIVESIDIAK